MTVAALAATIDYLEDGVTLAFSAPYRFLQDTDLIVTRISAVGEEQVLAHGSEWSATGGSTDAGGTVTLAASVAGSTLRIGRSTPRAQTSDYATGDRFPAETHELALDRAMMIAQEHDAKLADLDLRFPVITPNDWPGHTLTFDADGSSYVYAYDAQTILLVAALGTGAVSLFKSTAAAPMVFSATNSPVDIEAGAMLKVTVTGVNAGGGYGYIAVTLRRWL